MPFAIYIGGIQWPLKINLWPGPRFMPPDTIWSFGSNSDAVFMVSYFSQEQFGTHWPEVQAILRSLEGFGVFMVDVNPGNVAFADK